jgi:hypothetical protein
MKAIKALAVCIAIGGLIFGGYALFVVFGNSPPDFDKAFPQICTTVKTTDPPAESETRCKPDCALIPRETLKSLMADGTDLASAQRVLKWHKMYWRDVCRNFGATKPKT